jgi:hypothetical protein
MAKDRGLVIKFSAELPTDPANIYGVITGKQMQNNYVAVTGPVAYYGNLINMLKGTPDYGVATTACAITWTFATPTCPTNLEMWFSSAYVGKDWKMQGSNDNATWTDIFSGQQANNATHQSFANANNAIRYTYIRLNVTTAWTTRIDFFGIILICDAEGLISKNEDAFTVTSQHRRDALSTQLITTTHLITEVRRFGIDNDSIILLLNPLTRFRDIEDVITVVYDQAKGELKGRGGYVQSFTTTFAPTDLIEIPDPAQQENITVRPTISITVTKVNYSSVENKINYDLVPVRATGLSLVFTKVSGTGV